MSLAIDVDTVTHVLLADGWHKVKGSSFPISGRKNLAIRSSMSDCSASLSHSLRSEKFDF